MKRTPTLRRGESFPKADESKRLLVVGGPNGSGKTTFVRQFLALYPDEYLAADQIAIEICPGNPQSVPVQAGREFLRRLTDRIARGRNIVVESTLAGRSLARHIERADELGFDTAINFVFLDSLDACVARVSQRVRLGGHFVPDVDVRRRYARSLHNFWNTYRFAVQRWELHYNRGEDYLAVAHGSTDNYSVENEGVFDLFLKTAKAAKMIDRVKLSPDLHEWASEMTRIGAAGVRRAQEQARAAGVPCVYSINGILHWELPDGSQTTEDPWQGPAEPEQA